MYTKRQRGVHLGIPEKKKNKNKKIQVMVCGIGTFLRCVEVLISKYNIIRQNEIVSSGPRELLPDQPENDNGGESAFVGSKQRWFVLRQKQGRPG